MLGEAPFLGRHGREGPCRMSCRRKGEPREARLCCLVGHAQSCYLFGQAEIQQVGLLASRGMPG